MIKPDTAPAAPTPAVAIGSKAAPQPAKASTIPATGIGEAKITISLETAFSHNEDMFYLRVKLAAEPFFLFLCDKRKHF